MRIALIYMGREILELEYLSAILKQRGHEIIFAYDPGSFTNVDNIFNVPKLAAKFSRTKVIVRQLLDEKPDVLYCFVDSGNLQWATALAEQVKPALNAPVVFAGLHATMAPEAMMRREVVDFVVTGEAEESFPELLDAIENQRPPSTVKGIWYRQGEKVISTGMRAPIADLETLPMPDKDLFAPELNAGDDYRVLTGRGCPGSCTYCQEGVLKKLYGPKYFRRRKAESILNELELMKGRYNYTKVMINDPIFFTSKKWALAFLDGYKKRIDRPFRCYGQLKWIDNDIAKALKAAGCYGVEFGFQTANDRIRREILDRPETIEDARRAMRICDANRLRYDMDHIFGLPGETEQDYVDSARLYLEGRYLNRVKVHMLVYLPGAPILEIAQKMGLADDRDRINAEEGVIGDICRTGSVNREQTLKFIADWKNFYKLFPLLGRRLGRVFVDKGWNRWYGRIPGLGVIALQMLVALKGRDWRFWIYIKYYIHRYKRHKEYMRHAAAKGWTD